MSLNFWCRIIWVRICRTVISSHQARRAGLVAGSVAPSVPKPLACLDAVAVTFVAVMQVIVYRHLRMKKGVQLFLSVKVLRLLFDQTHAICCCINEQGHRQKGNLASLRVISSGLLYVKMIMPRFIVQTSSCILVGNGLFAHWIT